MTQGRLTEDEHDARAGLASAARTRAELDALTADLPADLAARRPTARDAWTGVCVSFAAATVLLAPPITVGLMVDARHQKRAGGQLRLGPALGAGR